MKFVASLSPRLPWLNLSAGLLILLLQRTPVLRSLLPAVDAAWCSRAGELLRAGFTVAGLGAMHSLAGATTYVQNPAGTLRGTVGTPLSAAFSFTGAPSDAQHWTILSGSLPPGMNFVPAPLLNIIRARDVGITGTPTQAGAFSIRVQAIGLAGQSDPITISFDIAGNAVVAPVITTQPQSQVVTAGATVTFSVQATGSPPPTFQWSRNGQAILGATSSTLTLPAVQAADAGSYSVVVSVAGASPVTSATATLTVNAGGGPAPTIALQPLAVTAAPGSTASFSVVAAGTGHTYQWRRNGAAVGGATDATLVLRTVSAAVAGDYTAVVTNAGNSTVSQPARLTIAAGEGRLANLSVRANLGASERLIVGFATNGEKSVLLRGIGPTLGTFGVGGAYADPRLELYNSSAAMLTQNDNWGGAATLANAFSAVGAFGLPNASRDAALQASIAGSHSAHVTGANSGVVLVEVYDSGAGTGVRLVNVSARNRVGTGDDILIAGFVVDGTVAKTLLIRAVGPTLGTFGVPGTLADPRLDIFNGATVKVAENDNWPALLGTTFGAVGAFQLGTGSRDAALLVTLMPGAYSAQVSGVGGGTGEALVEVYELP